MIKSDENMIVTNDIVKNNYGEYSNKDTKLSREVKNGHLFKIINILYETNKNTPRYLLAGSNMDHHTYHLSMLYHFMD